MKIAFFHNLPPGGAKRVVFEQIKYLSAKHEVDLYQIDKTDQLFPFEKFVSNIYTYNFSLDTRWPSAIVRLKKDFNNFFTLALLHKKIAEDIDKKNYDFIIVHPDKYTQAPFLLRYLKTKNIYYCLEWLRIVYESQFEFKEEVVFFKKLYEVVTRKIRKAVDKRNVIAADFILAISNYTANNIKKAYGRKAIVCYPGVDLEMFHPQKLHKKYDILFVGDKTDDEGYGLLFEIEKLFTKKLITKIISRKNSKFSLSDQMLAKKYNSAKIVICLAYNEPFGLIPLEAMACGVPVVAVNEGGYKETIVDGRTGFLVARDAKLVEQKLDYLLKNEKVRLRMGENSRKHVEENWTWDKNTKELETFLLFA